MTRLSALLPLLLLSGCWLTDPEIVSKYDDEDPDSDTEVIDPTATNRVVSVNPVSGTTSGGVFVTVVVDAVGSDPVVTVGGSAARIDSIEGNELIIELPSGDEGAVDVTVTSGGGSGTAVDGFFYWEDGEGKLGTAGEISWTHYTGELSALGYLDEGLVEFQVVRPTSDGFDAQYTDVRDRCTLSSADTDWRPYALDAMGARITSASGGERLTGYDMGTDTFTMDATDFLVPGATYSLAPLETNSEYPGFGIDDFVTLPALFTLDEPSTTTVNIAGDQGEYVGRTFDLEWSGPFDGAYIIVVLHRWETVGFDYQLVESARCVLHDDGSFRFPGNSLWTGYSIGAPLDIYISRVYHNPVVLPHNRSKNGVVGRYIIGGTLWQGL